MLIVYANSIDNELVADLINERTPVSEIIGLASTVEEARIMIIEHAKIRVNEDYADGFDWTREESWADYMTKEGIVQEAAGPVINYMQYFVADAK